MSDIQEGRLYAAAKYTSRSDWKETTGGEDNRWGGASFAQVVGEVNVDENVVNDWGGTLYAAEEHIKILESSDSETVLYEGPVRQGKRRRFIRAPATVTKIEGRGQMIKVHIEGYGNPYDCRHPDDGHDPFSKTDGADLILQERAYQMREHGYDPEHDMQHGADTLLDAAVSVLGGIRSDKSYTEREEGKGQTYLVTKSDGTNKGIEPWPFAADYTDHPLYTREESAVGPGRDQMQKVELELPGQQIHALAIAGAFIAAEIDRIMEKEYRKGTPLKPSQIFVKKTRKSTFMGVSHESSLTVKNEGMNALKRELPF